jgi:hypothetical protein
MPVSGPIGARVPLPDVGVTVVKRATIRSVRREPAAPSSTSSTDGVTEDHTEPLLGAVLLEPLHLGEP